MVYRDVFSYGLYGLMYEVMLYWMKELGWFDFYGVIVDFVVGGCVGIIMWVFIIFFDVVKSWY